MYAFREALFEVRNGMKLERCDLEVLVQKRSEPLLRVKIGETVASMPERGANGGFECCAGREDSVSAGGNRFGECYGNASPRFDGSQVVATPAAVTQP